MLHEPKQHLSAVGAEDHALPAVSVACLAIAARAVGELRGTRRRAGNGSELVAKNSGRALDEGYATKHGLKRKKEDFLEALAGVDGSEGGNARTAGMFPPSMQQSHGVRYTLRQQARRISWANSWAILGRWW